MDEKRLVDDRCSNKIRTINKQPPAADQEGRGTGFLPGECTAVHEFTRTTGACLMQHHTYNFLLQMVGSPPNSDPLASVPYRDRDVWVSQAIRRKLAEDTDRQRQAEEDERLDRHLEEMDYASSRRAVQSS